MAQVPEPYTLLVAVRSQLSLSLDSDSESSTSPDAASPSTKPHDQTNDNKVSNDETTDTQRPCECSTHEQNFFTTDSINSTLTIPSTSNDPTPTANTFLTSSFSSTNAESTENTSMSMSMSMNITQPTSFSSTTNTTNDTEPFPAYNESELAAYIEDEIAYREAFRAAMHQQIRTEKVDPFIEDRRSPPQDEVKAQSMEKLKEYLSDPHLHASTRERFISLTNMIVRLEKVLFCPEEEFLSPGVTAKAQEMAVTLLGYAAWADGVVEELLQATRPVRYVLGKMREEDVSEVVRYRNMACVVSAHLKKPRASEQKLLVQFAEVYDKWVHDKFLVLRNAQILAEERLESNRLQLTRYLHAIWAILARVNEGYAAYRQILNEIREKYFSEIVGVADGALGIFAKDLSVVI